jgi:CubicO group peptidase (beta-lactamase class C family)
MGYCKFLIFILIIFQSSRGFSQKENVNNYIDSALILDNYYGIAAVFERDSLIYYKAVGYEDKNNNTPLSESSLFDIGSIAKVLTGLMVLDLIEKRELSLEDSICKFFPDFQYKDVKIKHLLTHTSGITRVETPLYNSKFYLNNYVTNSLLYNNLNKNKKFRPTKAEEKYVYSNQNYEILAMLLEKIKKQNYRNLLKDYLAKFGVKNTFFHNGFPNIAHTTTPYLYSDALYSYKERKEIDRFILSDSTYGSGSVYSNILDLKKIGELFTENKLNISDSLLYLSPSYGKKNSTLIFDCGFVHKKKFYFHAGNSYGYNCIFGFKKESKRVYIILSNVESIASKKGNDNYEAIMFKLLKAGY